MDTLTTEQRKRVMRSNRGRTAPELALASALWRLGFRYLTGDGYRKRVLRGLPGNPDLVFPRRRVVLFMDGCFWHGCPVCRRTTKQNASFWRKKVKKNRERDRRVSAELAAEGWSVVRVPEHALRTKESFERTVKEVAGILSAAVP